VLTQYLLEYDLATCNVNLHQYFHKTIVQELFHIFLNIEFLSLSISHTSHLVDVGALYD
jgi:hypothetical protein